MSAHYYAALVDADGRLVALPGRPHGKYSEAIGIHARAISLLSPSWSPRPDINRRVLLDLGSVVPQDEASMKRLLADDPLLRSIFELGRRVGRESC